MTNRPDQMEEIFKGVAELRKQWLEDFDTYADGIPFGQKRMTDLQHSMWFAEMLRRYPPETWTLADGREATASPWLLALEYVEGGEKEAKRYVRTQMGATMERMEAMNVL